MLLDDNRVPKTIRMFIQYRDAGNWKSGDYYYWTNLSRLTVGQLNEALLQISGENGVVPYYYNLPQIAPIKNEFLPPTEDDHCYVEVQDPEYLEHEEGYYFGDIQEVINMISNPFLVEARTQEKLKEARKIMRDSLKKLSPKKSKP